MVLPLPISGTTGAERIRSANPLMKGASFPKRTRSEEHTSELQSRSDLVCRLLLEKKKDRRLVQGRRAAQGHGGRDGGAGAAPAHSREAPPAAEGRAARRERQRDQVTSPDLHGARA